MARVMMDNGAMPMAYYSPAPYAQSPYYAIPQPAHTIPHYSAAPAQYVYSPKAHMMQQVPQGFVAPNACHPVYVIPDGTMAGQPVHQQPFGAQPGGVQFVNSHGIPISESPGPYSLPAAQPGMRWKLVPVGDSDREEAPPIPSPKAAAGSAPVMLLTSPEDAGASSVPDSNAVSAQSDDPYKQFLSLLFPKLEDKVQDSEGKSKLAGPAISTASSVAPEVEATAATPKSVRIIPVTDAPKNEKRVTDSAPKSAALEGEGTSEKDCSAADTKAGPSSVKKLQPNKPSTPTLKPIRLVPSLDFVKKKENKPVISGSKQVNPQKSQGKAETPHHASSENSVREKEVLEENGEKVKIPEESPGPKTEVAAKRAREKGDEPSAKKKLITDSETAARLIQSAYRGFVVRRCQPLKHLRDIARVKSMLTEYQSLAADRSSLLEKCKDPAERAKISEGIMSLLLQLDVIQGVDPVVREIRKYTSKEVLKLQSEVDAAMADVSAQGISKERDEATPLRELDSETRSVDEEPNESVELSHDVAETLASKSEDMTSEKPEEEQVEDLLRKLLKRLPESGGCEGREPVECSDTDSSALISEVVKRLALLKDQRRDKDAETRCVNNHEQSDMRASENSSDEVLPSMSTAHEGSSQSGTADDNAATSEVELGKGSERTIDSAAEAEVSHVDDAGERGANHVPVSQPEASPTELELQNLAEAVAAEFVDVVLSHSEDTIGSVQSMGDNEENVFKGQYDTTLHHAVENDFPAQSANVDFSNAMAEAPKQLVNFDSEVEGTMTPIEIAGGETQSENSGVVDGEESTRGMLKASKVDDNDGEGPLICCESECNDSKDGPTFGRDEILHLNVTGDDKEELGAHEESVVASVEPANEEPASEKSLADAEEVQDTDRKDDAVPEQFAPAGIVHDSPTQATSSTHDENTVNGDAAEVRVESDNALKEAEASPGCSNAESSMRLWNGLDCNSTCHDSLAISSQSIAQDSEEATTGCIDEPHMNIKQQPSTANASDESENADATERMKVQIPNKSFPLQEEPSEVDSPTSVLDAAVSMAPAEDVLSEDTASEQPEGMKMPEQLIRDSEALQLQSAISDLESLNDESLQLESAISDLHSLNNSGQGFLNDLNPVTVRCPPLKGIGEEVYLRKPPSLSPEAQHVLDGGVSPRDVCERLYPSSASPPSSETELTLTQHLIEETMVLKELVKDVLKWSQWQSSATFCLHKMMEKLALEVLDTKTTVKKGMKCKQGRNKKVAKRKNNKL